MADSSSSDDECIDELIKRNDPRVRRAIDAMARAQDARAASSPVRSPWQQKMDEMLAEDESDTDEEFGSGDRERASLVTPPTKKTTTKKKKRTTAKKKPSPKRPPNRPPKRSPKKKAATATAAQQRRMLALPAKAKPTARQQQFTKDKSFSDQY